MKHLSVGEMAKLNHVSEQTLRLYDRMGLLCPTERSSETGYRYYDIRQCAVLDMIQYMKALGMSLKDIRAQLQSPDMASLESILHQRQEQIE